MASSITASKANSSSDLRRKVRIVAKIRANNDLEMLGSEGSWHKPIGDQPTSRKDSYKFDYCYEQGENVDQIFSREVKPLISQVFDGVNASVLAYGARGSGKTYMIQGSDEKPGLALLAMAEILSICEKSGNIVKVSCYQVFQDHAYDLLQSSGHEVLVLEDSQGKIQLKGLSEVTVKTTLEFHKLYFHESIPEKLTQKTKIPHRGHKGLIIHVHTKETEGKLVGKMNFVDLAGYEDTKRKSSDGCSLGEVAWINKSLYTLQNVVKALNTNDRVPYRESKLTRIMQDSLGGKSQTLMFTCLNPFFCQDTIYVANLASWSCEVSNQGGQDSIKKAKSVLRSIPPSPKPGKPQPTSSVKRPGTQLRVVDTIPHSVPQSVIKGRKLFNGASLEVKSSNKESCMANVTSSVEPSQTPKEEKFLQINANDMKLVLLKEDLISHTQVATKSECDAKALVIQEDVKIESDNINSLMDVSGSPPLSERLRALSDVLKSVINSSTPISIASPQKCDVICGNQDSLELVEPKTPIAEYDKNITDRSDVFSSHKIYSAHSSGLKHSVVRDYLTFLNTANKEELKKSKGIGEKRATYILELRETSPEPFKDLDDLKEIGLSTKQINGMMKKVAGGLFD